MKTKHLCFSFITILAIFGLFMNCATIIHGTNQDISITSSPEAAEINIATISGQEMFTGNTPATVTLKRNYDYVVKLNLAGYQETTVSINKEFDATYLGNILCGGILGLIIDAANGAMYMLEPGSINVTLMTASVDNEDEIYAVLRLVDFDNELREIVIPLIKS